MQTLQANGIFGGVAILIGLLTAPLALSQEGEMETSISKVGEEVFAAGESFSIGGNKGLAWAVGNNISVEDITGGLVAAGNSVDVQKGSTGPIIAAGSSVSINGPVGGSIYAAGESVDLAAVHTGGTVLAAGSNVEFTGSTTGSAYLAGDNVRVSGTIAGDLYVSAGNLSIAPEAVVGGEIVYDADTGVDIPDALNSRRVTPDELRDEVGEDFGFGFGDNNDGGVVGDIGFFIFSLIVGIVVIVLMRRQSDHFADWLTANPMQTFGTGFVGLSFWIGLTLTSIAIVLALASGLSWFLMVLFILVPVVTLAGFVLMLVAYYHGVYAVGSLAGRFLPLDALSPIAARIAILAATLFVLFLIGLVLPGIAMLLGLIAMVVGFGAIGLRIWKGLPSTAA